MKPASPSSLKNHPALWLCLFVCLGCAAYWPALRGGFVFDDSGSVLENETIRTLWPISAVMNPPVDSGVGGRPISNLSFAINHAFGGLNPVGYHVANVFLHACSGLLLFGFLRRCFQSQPLRSWFSGYADAVALASAVLWLLHPLQGASVAYISQRTELLMGFLYLLTLYAAFRSFTASGPVWKLVCLLACCLGMGCKESMATAPLMVLLLDRSLMTESFLEIWQKRKGFYFGLAATWLPLASLMLSTKLAERGLGLGQGISAFENLLTQSKALCVYLGLAFWPSPLVFDRGWYFVSGLGEAWPYLLVLFSVIVAVVVLGRPYRLWLLVVAFLLLLAPTSSFVPIIQQPIAENRMYLPLVIPVVTTVSFLFLRWRSAAVYLCAGLTLTCFLVTLERSRDYQSALQLWEDTVAKVPSNARAHGNLGSVLLGLGREQEAKQHLETALHLRPVYPEASNNLGIVLLHAGRLGEAVECFKKALSSTPRFPEAAYNMGEALLAQGRTEEAATSLRYALQLQPGYARAHNNLGVVLLLRGDLQGALKHNQEAVRLAPELPEAHYNLGNAQFRSGLKDAALRSFERATQLSPGDAKAHNNLGVVLLHLGKAKEAVRQFEEALRLKPDYPEASRNLSVAKNAVRE